MTQATDIGRRTRVTRPYPSYTLEDALSVARAIYDENAGLPFDRELLAQELGTTPKSSAFTIRLNASAAYGLTEGGYNDDTISLTELGEVVVGSDGDMDSQKAIVEAATFPETFDRFFEMLDGKRLPENANLGSILQRDLGVHPNLTEECLQIILDNGEFAGIISESGGYRYVRLPTTENPLGADFMTGKAGRTERKTPYGTAMELDDTAEHIMPAVDSKKGIFIGHIGDSLAANYVASMLDGFGIMSASPRIPEEDAGLLVPQEVSKAMRESSAAVLVFRSGDNAWSSRDKMIGMLGAASVLFDDRIVMVHEDGARMSIGLEGLKHIDFDHDRPGESGMALLVALHNAGVINVSA